MRTKLSAVLYPPSPPIKGASDAQVNDSPASAGRLFPYKTNSVNEWQPADTLTTGKAVLMLLVIAGTLVCGWIASKQDTARYNSHVGGTR